MTYVPGKSNKFSIELSISFGTQRVSLCNTISYIDTIKQQYWENGAFAEVLITDRKSAL